jgi:succinyl-diaminopimelate desuccinylase
MAARVSAPDPVGILQSLIRCPSVTPDDGGALDYLSELLTPAGFSAIRLSFNAPDTPDVDNLVLRIGSGRPHLCFAGHIDVVPPGRSEDWTHPPFAAETAEGFIYGRGAQDMKGPVAAFAAAALGAAKAYGDVWPGTLSLLLTADEEGPAINGTVKVLQWMADQNQVPDHCLVGEPTSAHKLGDTIKIGRRGSLSFTVSISGAQGHSAYPENADNPIPKLVRLLDRLASVRRDGGNNRFDIAKLDAGNEHFGASTLVITSVDVGNPASNVIPAHATARFNIRFNTQHSGESLIRWVDEQCRAVESEFGGHFDIAYRQTGDAFVTEPGAFVGIVQDAVFQETGLMPALSTSGGTSDARFIKNYCPVVEFGPTNSTIHQVNERIAIEELRATQRIYSAVIETYFGSDRP